MSSEVETSRLLRFLHFVPNIFLLYLIISITIRDFGRNDKFLKVYYILPKLVYILDLYL